ncbi:MAG: M15 family metallopeptidase [Defluviitaleaceae bacterium]|nr:M15 family metallopeptidase [Defluviitaleaceae bacterium]
MNHIKTTLFIANLCLYMAVVGLVGQANAAEPVFHMQPLPPHVVELVEGSSFHPETPFGLDFLTYLTISHRDFNGIHRRGHMIVAEEIGQEVLDIFEEIFHAPFPIARMRLIDFYGAMDYYSMADNNSVGFNFRTIAGTNVLSRHAFGMAIDINPVQNPYIRGETILPAAGAMYLDRGDVRLGMIVPGDGVYNAFVSRGWIWGGNWASPRDYHHFERR